MARIRTIKPEFPQSESMGNVSRDARLTFIQIWTIADDEGRLRGNSRMLASLLYPYDDDAKDLIDGWLDELEAENCIVRYRIDGATYIQILNWNKHQKIDKASKSKIPEYKEEFRINGNVYNGTIESIREDSRGFANDLEASRSLPVGVDQGVDHGVDQGKDRVPLASAFQSLTTVGADSAESARAEPSDAGKVCMGLKAAGIGSVNPSHPKLTALLSAGLTPDEIIAVAHEQGARGKGMAWVLAAAEGRRRDAAAVQTLPAKAKPRELPGGGIDGSSIGLGRIL